MGLLKPLVIAGKWVLALALVGSALAGVYLVKRLKSEQRGGEASEGAGSAPKFIQGVIKLNDKSIETVLAKEIDWVPRAPIYGRVVPNPRATIEIRTAFAGRLRGSADGKWPTVAGHVKAGELLGQLEVRVGPQDRLDLQAKLGEAKLKHDGARKIAAIYQERVKRFESSPTSLARSELDAALVALAEAQTQLATSEAAVKLYHEALTAIDQQGDGKPALWTLPLTAPADGEITELAARPDMVVEAGSLIARVVDFRKALVRVDIPLLLLNAAPPRTLQFVVLPPTPPAFEGPTNRAEAPPPPRGLTGELVGVAPQVDPTLQATGYLYEVSAAGADGGLPASAWRPGLFVKALLPVHADKPLAAVAVPSASLLFHQGRALVYVALANNRYKRVEVKVLGREGDLWVLEAGPVDGDDPVVTRGALLLLSAEFRADVDD